MLKSNSGGERTPLLNSSGSGSGMMMRGRLHQNSNSNSNINDNVASGLSQFPSIRDIDLEEVLSAQQQQQQYGQNQHYFTPSHMRSLPNDSDIILDGGGDDDKEDRRSMLHRMWQGVRMHGQRLRQRVVGFGLSSSLSTFTTSNNNATQNEDVAYHMDLRAPRKNKEEEKNQEEKVDKSSNEHHFLHEKVANGDDYYEDTLNDEPWSCSFGTKEEDGIWLNLNDRGGLLMAMTVWLLIFYSAFTILLLTRLNHVRVGVAALYCTICFLALLSHAKTMLTDPGAVPSCALPVVTKGVKYHAMCAVCQSYKPPNCTHHCRICNRCVVRMDHHCPWMNNCIGVNNLKHFVLFLIYTWMGSVLALMIFAINYFFCTTAECQFDDAMGEIHLVRVMTFICLVTLCFTSSMLMNVIYGITTGIGTIDRLKKKADDEWNATEEEPIPLRDIVGISTKQEGQTAVARLADWWLWCLPVDPQFDDHDRVMGYATAVRLLREQQQKQQKQQHQTSSSSSPYPSQFSAPSVSSTAPAVPDNRSSAANSASSSRFPAAAGVTTTASV